MKKKKGFTLSEVLITLTVIGIIAAITINILNTNAREAEVETKLKRMVGILNMALFRASIEHGPSYTWQESDSDIFNEKYLIPNLRLIKPPIAQSLSDIGYKKTWICDVCGDARGLLMVGSDPRNRHNA